MRALQRSLHLESCVICRGLRKELGSPKLHYKRTCIGGTRKTSIAISSLGETERMCELTTRRKRYEILMLQVKPRVLLNNH